MWRSKNVTDKLKFCSVTLADIRQKGIFINKYAYTKNKKTREILLSIQRYFPVRQ
jgi:hypothetical protein